MTVTTGAFGNDTITVDQMVKDPTYIQGQILENMDRAFLEAGIFRNGGTNDGVVAFHEAAAPFLDTDAEDVAEFAEIPLGAVEDGKLRSVIGHKIAKGVSISLEMREYNKIDRVSQNVTALQNTMVSSSVKATLKAFDAAKVPVLTVADPFDSAAANPIGVFRTAKRMISQAKTDDNRLFGYKPDTMVISESALEAAIDHEQTQKFFRGNLANENPLYLGTTPNELSGLRIVTSAWLEEDEIYVMESQKAGFYSDSIPLTVTELYAPNGDNGYGGTTQSWRADAFRTRIIAVDNPKAVVKIENALGEL